MNSQVIITPNGERLVMLPEAEFERLRDAAEMAFDVAAYDEAKRRLASGEEDLLPSEMVKRILSGENPIRVWREHRGMSVKALAESVGIAAAYLSQVETGKRDGTVDTFRKIAAALSITIDDLI